MNFNTQTLARGLFALALTAAAALAQAATSFHAEIDTAAFANSDGWLDIQFNPGALPAVAATATLSNFSGSFGNAQFLEGEASGSLVDGFVLGNGGNGFNNLFQSLKLGGKFAFDISFGGAYASTAGDVGSSFSVGLLSADQSAYLGNPDGVLFKIELTPLASSLSPEIANNSITSVTAITAAVPEPASYALLLGGLLLLSALARRQAR